MVMRAKILNKSGCGKQKRRQTDRFEAAHPLFRSKKTVMTRKNTTFAIRDKTKQRKPDGRPHGADDTLSAIKSQRFPYHILYYTY